MQIDTGTQVINVFIMRISIYEAINVNIYKDYLFCFVLFIKYSLKRKISNGNTCSTHGIKHVIFVKKIMNVTTKSVEKNRLTGTPTPTQIVRDVS